MAMLGCLLFLLLFVFVHSVEFTSNWYISSVDSPVSNLAGSATITWFSVASATGYRVETRAVEETPTTPTRTTTEILFRTIETLSQPAGGSGVAMTTQPVPMPNNGLNEIKITPFDGVGDFDWPLTVPVRGISGVPGSSGNSLRLFETHSTSLVVKHFHPSSDRFTLVSCTVSGDPTSCNSGSPIATDITTGTQTVSGLVSGDSYVFRAIAGNSNGYQPIEDSVELSAIPTAAAPGDDDQVLGLHIDETNGTAVKIRFVPRPTHTTFRTLLINGSTLELSSTPPAGNVLEAAFFPTSGSSSLSEWGNVLERDYWFDGSLEQSVSEPWAERVVFGLVEQSWNTLCILPGNNNGYSTTAHSCVTIQPTNHLPRGTTPVSVKSWYLESSAVSFWFSHPAATLFHIDVRELGSGKWSRAVTASKRRTARIDGLTSDVVHEVRVIAANGFGQQKESGWGFANATTTSTVPGRVSNLRVTSITATESRVEWDNLAEATHFDVIQVDSSAVLESHIDVSVVDLALSTETQIRVLPTNNHGTQTNNQQASTITIQPTNTNPTEPIQNLRIADTTNTTITVVFERSRDSSFVSVSMRRLDGGRVGGWGRRVAQALSSPVDLALHDVLWVPPKTQDGTADWNSVTVADLVPGGRYEFWIQAHNSYGRDWTTPRNATKNFITATTTSTTPSSHVTDVTVVALGTATPQITLVWTGIPEATYYQVFVAASGSGSYSQVGASDANLIVSDANAFTTYTIAAAELSSGILYDIQVRAGNRHGIQDSSVGLITIQTQTTTSPGVSNIRIEQCNSFDVHLSWDLSPTAFFTQISIQSISHNETAFEIVENILYRRMEVTYPRVEYVLENVNVGVSYFVQLLAGEGIAEGSEVVEASAAATEIIRVHPTLELPPPPTELRITAMTSTTVTLEWNGPDQAFFFHIVKSTPLGETTLDSDFRYVDTTVNSGRAVFSISGLVAGDGTHTFIVYSGNEIGVEAEGASYTVDLTDSAPVAPEEFEVSEISATTMKLRWNKVNEAFAYDVQVADASDGVFQDAVVDIGAPTTTVSGLVPSTQYIFTVTARNTQGNDEFMSDVFETSERTNSMFLHGASVSMFGESSIILGAST